MYFLAQLVKRSYQIRQVTNYRFGFTHGNVCDCQLAKCKLALHRAAMRIDDPHILRAIERAGGGTVVAARLGLTRQAIYQWRRIPAQYVIALERLSGVSRRRLRPDLYPRERIARR